MISDTCSRYVGLLSVCEKIKNEKEMKGGG